MSGTEDIGLPPIAKCLRKAVGHTYSDEFWQDVNKSNRELHEQTVKEERSLRPSWEMMHRPFDI